MSTNYSPTLGSDRYLNTVNHQYPGSYGPEQTYPGMLGQEMVLSAAEALALTDTTVTGYSASAPLLAGRYKYVKFAASLTITPARGIAVYWDAASAFETFIVDTDSPTAGTQFAGICLNVVTAGYYGWILIEGEGYALGKAVSLTNAGAAGQLLSPVAATGAWDNPLTAALTDSGTGDATVVTIAAGVGQYVLAIHCTLAQISGAGDVLTNHVLGHKFKLLSFDAVVDKVVTTGAKAASFNLEIGTTDVTGGVVALTSANCTPLGARVAGSAITAANTGSAAATLSIEASSVTAFAEGEVIFLIRIQNMDTADAIAAMASQLNALRNASLYRVVAFETPVAATLKRVYVSGTLKNVSAGLQ